MSRKEIGNIPRIVEELIEHLHKEMDDELKKLIARAKEGQDTTVEIVNLFSKHENTRQWLKEQIKSQGGEKGTPRVEHGPLAGNLVWIPPSQKWVCPINPQEHWLMVMQAEEDAPMCPMCKKANRKEEMVREHK